MRKEFLSIQNEIIGRVDETLVKASEFQEIYNVYSFLWSNNKKEHMSQFLLYNHVLTEHELNEFGKTIFSFPEIPPTIDQFREKVDFYDQVYNEIKKLEDMRIVDKWLRLNARYLKRKLLNFSLEWKNMYKNHIQNDVVRSIYEFDEFILKKEHNFKKDIKNADYNVLVDILKDLNDIRQKNNFYDNFFDTLDEKIKFIEYYGDQISQEIQSKIKKLPEKWSKIKKKAKRLKRSLAPLQAAESQNIEKKILFCKEKEKDFYDKFKKKAPYGVQSKDVYFQLDYVSHFHSLSI